MPVKDIMGMPTQRIIRREAAGVVAAITPWNYPFYLNICKVAAALAAGCTVVLKPAPDTPAVALAIGELAAEHTDIPPGVLNVVTTSDNSVAEILATHPDVDQVTLTGSTGTGRKVMTAAAGTIKRVTLELGGKSAAVLLDDADFSTLVPAFGGGVCAHAGQGCTQMTRLLVPRARYDEVVATRRRRACSTSRGATRPTRATSWARSSTPGSGRASCATTSRPGGTGGSSSEGSRRPGSRRATTSSRR